MSDALTLAQAAAYARVHPRTLAEHCASGKLPARNVGTGDRCVWRILRSALDLWLAPPRTPC